MPDELLQVALQLEAGNDADAEEIEEVTEQLRRHLLELDVASVDRVRVGEAPPGSRGLGRDGAGRANGDAEQVARVAKNGHQGRSVLGGRP